MRKPTYNVKELKQNRIDLRAGLTSAEALLWKSLQRSQLSGKKFRRQHSIGPYIVDFFCPETDLAIELDGEGHYIENRVEADATRTEFLNKKGIRVLRFENKEIFNNLEFVLAEIERNLIS